MPVVGTITGFDSETITKPGKKPFTVHKVSVDGVWYECGYKKPSGVGIGSLVQFEAEKKFGKMAVIGEVMTAAAGTPPSLPISARRFVALSGGGGYSRGDSTPPQRDEFGVLRSSRGDAVKEFPVPVMHPDRSIVRQNALAHATNLVIAFRAGSEKVDLSDSEAWDAITDRVIAVAYDLERYATGAIEREAAAAGTLARPE